MKCRPVTREEEEEIEFLRREVSEQRRAARNIVTPKLLLESGLLQGMTEVPKIVVTVEGSLKVVVDPEERQRKLRERREKDMANKAKKKQAKESANTAEGIGERAAEKRPWQGRRRLRLGLAVWELRQVAATSEGCLPLAGKKACLP
ncbi:hypothetical protein L3X38_024064 [Prunus dulcis]|uniref:Uncharacterized protein n=1 Tax=Prunus dulcis TaxID=3755 RepID=A0AAD4W1U4_PRUDU|nr:hypothetical protein L3X38_024064 [Prunus dulcis]